MGENNSDSDPTLIKNYPWLTEDLFKGIIEKDIAKQAISIRTFLVKRALKHGENYASQMIRVTVNYSIVDKDKKTDEHVELIEKRFVIKAALANEDMQRMMNEFNIFGKEITIYQKILPESERLLRSIGDYTKLTPRCYDGSVKDSYIIFEDLTKDGYRNTDRRVGLNLNHCKKVLEKVAKFHATTAILVANNHPDVVQFRQSVYNEDSEDVKRFTDICIQSVAAATKTLHGFEEISKKLDKISDKLFKRICRAIQYDENAFNVLTHGDLWANNTMFVYGDGDTESPTDALLVDFQVGSTGPAVLDLSYMLFTSSQEDIRDDDWDRLIQYYHEILKDTLEKLKYSGKIPSLTDIQVQFLQKAQCMMVLGIFLQGIRRYEDADENTQEIFFQDTPKHREMRMKILTHPDSTKSLHFLLEYFNRKGFFE